MMVREVLVISDVVFVSVSRMNAARGGFSPSGEGVEINWAIRTARLRLLPDFHLRPIDVVVFHGP